MKRKWLLPCHLIMIGMLLLLVYLLYAPKNTPVSAGKPVVVSVDTMATIRQRENDSLRMVLKMHDFRLSVLNNELAKQRKEYEKNIARIQSMPVDSLVKLFTILTGGGWGYGDTIPDFDNQEGL